MSVFYSEAKYTLPFTEKCGEISFSFVTKRAVCFCIFCDKKFVKLNYFIKHIKQRHLNKVELLNKNIEEFESSNNLIVKDSKPIDCTSDIEAVRKISAEDPLELDQAIKTEPNEQQVETSLEQKKEAEYHNTNLIDGAEIKNEIDCDTFTIPNTNETETESHITNKEPEKDCLDSLNENTNDGDRNCAKPKAPVVNDQVVYALIKKLEEHPNVWKRTHEDYCRNLKRFRSYDIIAKELQELFPNEQVRRKWVQTKSTWLFGNLRKNAKKDERSAANSKYYSALTFLNEHLIEQPGRPKRYKCKSCETDFSTYKNMELHMKRHRREYSVKCDICSKEFYTKSELRKHMFTHTKVKPHICEVCGHAFALLHSLNVHRKRHFNQRDHKCTICPKAFYCTITLREHMASHSNSYTIKCEVCERMFKTKSSMRRHMEIHNPVKQYPCSVCDRAFSQSSQRSMHMRSHRI